VLPAVVWVMLGRATSFELGASLAIENELGETPLDAARLGGNDEIVKILVAWSHRQ
jgi:hypothetical protein